MSSDGRCLCPTSEQHGACSCIAADWKRVRLQREWFALLLVVSLREGSQPGPYGIPYMFEIHKTTFLGQISC
ncbi:unnamed protein product [Strongylus vulgaris]|uniref:Uncharacterized protein n=1 Tax=Strongylus vulgaris TaxID=40348 RepID=A0A3P7LWY7_STRVU|nr:unnamed protein product [Strongylus vulgaris]